MSKNTVLFVTPEINSLLVKFRLHCSNPHSSWENIPGTNQFRHKDKQWQGEGYVEVFNVPSHLVPPSLGFKVKVTAKSHKSIEVQAALIGYLVGEFVRNFADAFTNAVVTELP